MIALAATCALAFALINGAIDAGTLAGSVVSSRALSPRPALIIAALGTFTGAMLLGSAIVHTLGRQIVDFETLHRLGVSPLEATTAAAAAALGWSVFRALVGLPGSFTHALLGGWLGAFLAIGGPGAVYWKAAALMLVGVLLAPVAGLTAAWTAMRLFYTFGERLSSRTQRLMSDFEVLVFGGLSVAHGASATQSAMALLAVGALDLSAGAGQGLPVPVWVRVICATAYSLGILLGATRTLRTVGFRICRVGTVHSSVALTVSSALVLTSTLVGLPISPGQLNSSCLMGVGAGHNPKTVRWGVAVDMMTNWMLTFPVAAALGYALVKVL